MTPTRKTPSVGVGFVVIGSELVTFTLLGLGLDTAFQSGPWLLITFTLLGFAAAVLLTVRLLRLESAARKGPPA